MNPPASDPRSDSRPNELSDAYRLMAEDEAREAEAREWVEGTLLTFDEAPAKEEL